MDIVGDMRELPELLEMVGLEFNHKKGSAMRHGAQKMKYPSDKSLLSNRTVDALCEYLALDYYLFDFEPPTRCHNQIDIDIRSILAQDASDTKRPELVGV